MAAEIRFPGSSPLASGGLTHSQLEDMHRRAGTLRPSDLAPEIRGVALAILEREEAGRASVGISVEEVTPAPSSASTPEHSVVAPPGSLVARRSARLAIDPLDPSELEPSVIPVVIPVRRATRVPIVLLAAASRPLPTADSGRAACLRKLFLCCLGMAAV